MSLRIFSVSLVLLGLGCGVSDADLTQAPEDSAQDGSEIQAGRVDSGDKAAVLVWLSGGFCSGSLIAPNVVLTAAHCVTEPVTAVYFGTGSPLTDAEWSSGPVEGPKRVKVAAAGQVAHPSYSASGGCPNSTYDIGLVKLATNVAGVTPLKVGAAPALKASCRAVGFGTHTVGSTDQYGQKRSGTETVISLDTTSLEVQKSSALADSGDSGGPLICGTKVVGVTSCHTDGDWPTHNQEYYGRLDGAQTWITQTVASWK